MAKNSSKPKEHLYYHKDGSLWARGQGPGARGQELDGIATGYWEWDRKDGVICDPDTQSIKWRHCL